MAATIKSARTALEVLQFSQNELHRSIAYGVLKLFVDQQEQKEISNNSKNTEMRNFNDLSAAQQEQIRNRFVLPDDRDNLQVDENGVPFERISGHLVGCTVRNTNFHVHGNKQNRQ